MIKINSKTKISNHYPKIRKKEVYEPIILAIMNDSKVVFSSKYKHIDIQDNSEPDFIDIYNNYVYDAKLLFPNEVCIALSKWNISDFANGIQESTNIDFKNQIKKTELYRLIKDRTDKLKDSEFGILFLPFPILMCTRDSIFNQLCVDQIDLCIKELNLNDKIYFIGLNIYGEIVCKEYGEELKIEYMEDKFFTNELNTNIVSWNKEDN